ncbi:cobalamin biosynthesis protein CobD [Chloroflexia bacterium SDU3-3]|nr:cobalamin biosynthesis protein CobD [Chloroflexia bacterium SDU3-3]
MRFPPLLGERGAALLLALALDSLLPELPNDVHPVVWMGRWMRLGERLAPQRPELRLAWGAGWLALGGLIVAQLAGRLPRHWAVRGALASTLLAYAALDRAAGQVQAALAQGDLPEARRLLGWHLVSRPTAELRADEVAGAAIESLAENFSDSVVAPALAYIAGGLPGLAVYRLSNTADAMWGYHTPRFEHLGKAAARWDDLLNLLPARLAAGLIALAAGEHGGRAWRVALRDHRNTASPNAGWPMAAMAGALDTTVTKRGHYALGDGAALPDAALLGRARRIVRLAFSILLALLSLGAASSLMYRLREKRP